MPSAACAHWALGPARATAGPCVGRGQWLREWSLDSLWAFVRPPRATSQTWRSPSAWWRLPVISYHIPEQSRTLPGARWPWFQVPSFLLSALSSASRTERKTGPTPERHPSSLGSLPLSGAWWLCRKGPPPFAWSCCSGSWSRGGGHAQGRWAGVGGRGRALEPALQGGGLTVWARLGGDVRL